MTLSPGAKVHPNRSTLRSPAGFNAACSSMFSERAPTPPRFIGHSTWMSRIGSRPNRLGMRVVTRRVEMRHGALVDPMGVDDDPAGCGLPKNLGQAHDRHRA